MDPVIRARRFSGDQPGSTTSKLIQGDVPDKRKRAGASIKPKASSAVKECDFSDEIQESDIDHDPVDTSIGDASAQAVNQELNTTDNNLFTQKETEGTITLEDWTRGAL